MASIRIRGTLKEAKIIRELLRLNGWRVMSSRMGAERASQDGAIFWIYAWPLDEKQGEQEDSQNGDVLELR